MVSGGSRVGKLASIRCPTLVIRGALDPLVPVVQGKDVHDVVVNADLLVIEEMAHDIPDNAVPGIAD